MVTTITINSSKLPKFSVPMISTLISRSVDLFSTFDESLNVPG